MTGKAAVEDSHRAGAQYALACAMLAEDVVALWSEGLIQTRGNYSLLLRLRAAKQAMSALDEVIIDEDQQRKGKRRPRWAQDGGAGSAY